MNIRTDLAIEAKRFYELSTGRKTELNGVSARKSGHAGIPLEIVEILNEEGARELNKPVGCYVTVDLSAHFRREQGSFRKTVEAIVRVLRGMLPGTENLLVVGLGNQDITPDTVGPRTLDNLIVTRHLKQSQIPVFQTFGAVSAIAPGVLGKTGIESVELVTCAVEKIKPDCVIVVDALASCEPERLCMSVQITDTGIVPGSGVGNHRSAFTAESLGVPVFAIGVPTVVDGRTFLALHSGKEKTHSRNDLILAPRDIDLRVAEIGKLIGYGIDLTMHHAIDLDDIPGFLS